MIDRKKLQSVLESWWGTPYMAGCCAKGPGGGVDCVRKVDAVLAETLGLDLPPLPRVCQDAAWHDKEVTATVQRALFERFDLCSMKTARYTPGDLIVVQVMQKQPGQIEHPHHILIVGPDPRIMWDAWPGVGVRQVGIGAIGTVFEELKIWRSMR